MFDRLKKTTVSEALIALCAASIVSLGVYSSGVFGVRKTVDEYSAQYLGKPAVVKREDVRLGKDRFYVLLNEQDRINLGKIVTDDNKELTINNRGYTVRDFGAK